ncbi:GSTT1 family protein [Megaselia abdita]
MTQPVKFYFDLLSQPCRALYIFLEAAKIPYEAVPISLLKGEHLTGEFRDKVNRFKKLPAINDHGFQLSESVAIFRHLSREKLVPEHWYPRKNLARSRIDEFMEWQHLNLHYATTDYYRQKWLLPTLTKSCPNEELINQSIKRLESTLTEFESHWLKSHDFMVGSKLTIADLLAICQIDQPKIIGYNPFKNRKNLIRWYELVRESLGPHYLDAVQEFEAKIKAHDNQKMSIQQ